MSNKYCQNETNPGKIEQEKSATEEKIKNLLKYEDGENENYIEKISKIIFEIQTATKKIDDAKDLQNEQEAKNYIEKIKEGKIIPPEALLKSYENKTQEECIKCRYAKSDLAEKLQPIIDIINSNLNNFSTCKEKDTVIENLEKSFFKIYETLKNNIGSERDFNNENVVKNFKEILNILNI